MGEVSKLGCSVGKDGKDTSGIVAIVVYKKHLR